MRVTEAARHVALGEGNLSAHPMRAHRSSLPCRNGCVEDFQPTLFCLADSAQCERISCPAKPSIGGVNPTSSVDQSQRVTFLRRTGCANLPKVAAPQRQCGSIKRLR